MRGGGWQEERERTGMMKNRSRREETRSRKPGERYA